MSGKDLEPLIANKVKNEALINLNILLTARDHWHWFAVSLFIYTACAFLFLRYVTLQYQVTASLLIRDESRGGDFGDAALLEELGLGAVKSSVDNEIEILKSRSLMENVVSDLQLYVQYFAAGRLKVAELYDKSPFRLFFLKPHLAGPPAIYQLKIIDRHHYRLITLNQSFRGCFDDTIRLPQGLAILKETRYQPAKDDHYIISVAAEEETIRKCMEALSVSATNKMGSVVDLSITDELPEKGEAILKKLLENYLKTNVKDKNRIADNTIVFIDKSLAEVSAELGSIEKSIESFRTNYGVVNFTEQARLLLQSASQYSEEQNSQLIRLRILESLRKNLQKNEDLVIPSSLFEQASEFSELAKKFNEAQLLHQQTMLSVNEANPILIALKVRIKALKRELVQGINTQINELELSIHAFDHYTDSIQNQISKIPGLEKQYVSYTRQQQIKQDLYLFLLKKKVETALSKSSAIANGRIIDPPKAKSRPSSPSRQLVLLISGLFSIAIPLGVLHLKNILNDRISTRVEIQENCQVPILAEINYQRGIAHRKFDPTISSLVTEQFRALRTNIQFLIGKNNCQTILVTSGTGGEGKSFIAVNLCYSLALAGKKVILTELDLRKPTLSDFLNVGKMGINELLTSDGNVISHIQKFNCGTTFDIITSGHPPPNPAEMLALPKVAETISWLRERYDYIIFDTPPIGLVTDARLLSRYADLSLYVVRQQVTFKHQLADIWRIQEQGQLPGLHIILNGVRQNARYQYNYGYQHKKQHWTNRLFRKLKSLYQNL